MTAGTSNRTVAGSGTLRCGSESEVPYWKYTFLMVTLDGLKPTEDRSA
jgi:hypothetical protein